MKDDIALFVEVARRQSLSAAASALRVPVPTVSRRLKKLEDALGLQLMHRSARRFSLTPEGEAYFEAYADLIDRFDEAARHLSGELHQLSGRLTVSAPTNISIGLLQPMWSGFILANPTIRLQLVLSNEIKDMQAGRVDLALRIGPQPDSGLFQRRLGEITSILVASPDYLAAHGEPRRPEQLAEHRLVMSKTFSRWQLRSEAGEELELVGMTPAVMVDDINLAAQFARDGIGITLMPVSEIIDELETGQLLRIMPEWRGKTREIFTVWPTGRLLSARAKHLRDFITAYIAGRGVLQGAVPEHQK